MNVFDEKAIIERVRYLRRQYSGERGKSTFAHALGLSPSTYSYYEKNRVPPIEVLLKIRDTTGADLDWLLTGAKSEKDLPPDAHNSLLRKLDVLLKDKPELAAPVSAFVELLSEKQGLERHLRPAPPPPAIRQPGWIPVLGRTAAGILHFWNQTFLPEPKQAVTELDDLVKRHIGKAIVGARGGKVSVDLKASVVLEGLSAAEVSLIRVGGDHAEEIVEFVESEEIHNLFPDSFALHTDGDSMSPRINDGDIVIVSPSIPAVQGQIGIARLANQIGVTCKLIRMTEESVHLIPINEKYETKVSKKHDLLWALAVLCHIRI